MMVWPCDQTDGMLRRNLLNNNQHATNPIGREASRGAGAARAAPRDTPH
jgi:hypothetical protein